MRQGKRRQRKGKLLLLYDNPPVVLRVREKWLYSHLSTRVLVLLLLVMSKNPLYYMLLRARNDILLDATNVANLQTT